jgi:hypothetical protein
MAAKSYFLDGAVLNAVLRNTAYVPANAGVVWAALLTTVPALPDGVGLVEVPTGGGSLYLRQTITFGAPSGVGVTLNTAPVAFPAAGTVWGTINGVGIYDASAAGNLLYFGTLGVPKTVGIGDTVTFATSALSVTEQ